MKPIKLFIVILFLLLTGCQGSSEQLKLEPITLAEAYPGSILDVDKMVLLDGTTGERKIIEDSRVIKQWITQIKDIELTPDPNQEQRTGYMYGISLYEGEELKLGFIPNQIHKVYYLANTEFVEYIKAFFVEQFGRDSK